MKTVKTIAEIRVGDLFKIPLTPGLTERETDGSGPDHYWTRRAADQWSVYSKSRNETLDYGGPGEGDPEELFFGVTEFYVLDSSDEQNQLDDF